MKNYAYVSPCITDEHWHHAKQMSLAATMIYLFC